MHSRNIVTFNQFLKSGFCLLFFKVFLLRNFIVNLSFKILIDLIINIFYVVVGYLLFLFWIRRVIGCYTSIHTIARQTTEKSRLWIDINRIIIINLLGIKFIIMFPIRCKKTRWITLFLYSFNWLIHQHTFIICFFHLFFWFLFHLF